MSLDANIVGSVVNADDEVKTALTQNEAKAGYAIACGEAHDGVAGSARVVRPIDVSPDFRLRAGVDVCMWSDSPGLQSAINAAKYRQNTSGMSITASGGLLVLNGANSVANGNLARSATYCEFSVPPSGVLYSDIPFAISAAPATGQVMRFGVFRQPASTADADDGVYIELTTAGVWQGAVMYSGGGAAAAAVLAGFAPVIGKVHLALIVQSQYGVDFYIDGILYGSVLRPSASADIIALGSAPLTAYIANTSALASACQLRIGKWGVTYGDLDSGISYEQRLAISGNSGHSFPGGGASSNIVNSTAPVSATLSNTAAGYNNIDGAFQWVAVAGSEVDYALFSTGLNNPSITQKSPSLLISGARISIRNQGAANSATVPTTVEFYLGFGSTAVSLATADGVSAGTRAPRRQYLGQISIPVNSVVGQPGDREIDVTFPPVPIEPGTFVHIIARILSGAATASQIIRGQASLNKQWTE